MYIIIVVGVLLLVVLLVKAAMGGSESRKLPPGPPPKPLLGNLFDVDSEKLHQSFTDISRDYGDVFTLRVSGKVIVVINTIEAYRELYGDERYGAKLSGRERNFISEYLSVGRDVPTSSNTPGYRKRRETLAESTKMFTEFHTAKINEELLNAVDFVGFKTDKPLDLGETVQLYLTSVYLAAITGEAYTFDDPRLHATVERVDSFQVILLPKNNGLLTNFPFLRHFPFGNGPIYSQIISLNEKLKAMIFDPLKTSYNSHNMRGGIDCLIREQQAAGKDLAPGLTDDSLWHSAFSTVGAGTGVGIGYILYFFVVILHYPVVAKRIRDEIEAVIGKEKLPSLADREFMPYTEAVLLELQRWVTPAPLLVPRRVENDIEFRGYTIPKDTTLIVNAWKIHHDETRWKDAWGFKPERFLDTDGKVVEELRTGLVTFGGGKRKCIGQSLAMDAAFLFITAMLQRFTFDSVPGSDLPPLDPHESTKTSAGIKPEPFKVVVNHRRS